MFKKGNNWDFFGKNQNWERATKTNYGFLKSLFIPDNGIFKARVLPKNGLFLGQFYPSIGIETSHFDLQ